MAIDREGWHLLSPAVKGFLLDAGREGYVKLTSPVVSNLKYSESGRDAMRNIFVAEYQQLCDDVTRLNSARARTQRVIRHRTPPQTRPPSSTRAVRPRPGRAINDRVEIATAASDGWTSSERLSRPNSGSPAMRSLASAIANVLPNGRDGSPRGGSSSDSD